MSWGQKYLTLASCIDIIIIIPAVIYKITVTVQSPFAKSPLPGAELCFTAVDASLPNRYNEIKTLTAGKKGAWKR